MAVFEIDWFRWETMNAFEQIRVYFKLIEKQIEEASILDKCAIDMKPKPKDEEEYQLTIGQEIAIHEHQFKEILPRIMSYSFISMLYSETEFRLKELCNELEKRRNLPLSLSKFRGNVIERISNFFEAFSLSSLQSDEAKMLKDFALIRNCV